MVNDFTFRNNVPDISFNPSVLKIMGWNVGSHFETLT